MLTFRLSTILRRYPNLHILILRLRDVIGLSPHEAEFDLLPLFCEPGQLALDVGANVGAVTRIFLGAGARVLAVEPIPSLGRILKSRFSSALENGRLTVESCILSDHCGTATLFIPDIATGLASVEVGAWSDEGSSINVAARTLDSLCDATPTIVKIDVEGHETAVVAGGLNFLARARPVLLIESEDRHHPGSLRELEAMLAPLGYEGYFIENGVPVSVKEFDLIRHQGVSALNSEGTARIPGSVYINNFLFFPEASPAFGRLKAYLRRQRLLD